MKTIKAYTGYNENTNTHYYTRFDIVEKLPEVGDYYDGDKVVKVEDTQLDIEQGRPEVYDYDYYRLTVVVDDEEEEERYCFVAVEKDYSSYRKLYYIRTNGYDLVASTNWEGELVGYLTQTAEFPIRPDEHEAAKFLDSIEDDSSWETDVDDVYDLIEGNEVIAELDTDL